MARVEATINITLPYPEEEIFDIFINSILEGLIDALAELADVEEYSIRVESETNLRRTFGIYDEASGVRVGKIDVRIERQRSQVRIDVSH